MTTQQQHTVVCYDIADDRRRKKAAGYLEQHLHRVQYSVFEGRTNFAFRQELQATLKEWCGQGDSVRIYIISDQTVPFCSVIGDGLAPSATNHMVIA